MTDTIYCQYCGSENSISNNFCENCGQALDEIVKDTIQKQTEHETPYGEYKKPSNYSGSYSAYDSRMDHQKKKSKLSPVALILLVLFVFFIPLIIMLILFFVFIPL